MFSSALKERKLKRLLHIAVCHFLFLYAKKLVRTGCKLLILVSIYSPPSPLVVSINCLPWKAYTLFFKEIIHHKIFAHH